MTKIAFGVSELVSAAEPTMGTSVQLQAAARTIQAAVTAGGTARVVIEVSLDNVNFLELATITLDSETPCDGFTSDAPWRFIRAKIVEATANTTVLMGV